MNRVNSQKVFISFCIFLNLVVQAFDVQMTQFFFWFHNTLHEDWILEKHESAHFVTCLQKCRKDVDCQGIALGPLNNGSEGYERPCHTLSTINETDCYENEDCYQEGFQVYHLTKPYDPTTTEMPTTTSTFDPSTTSTFSFTLPFSTTTSKITTTTTEKPSTTATTPSKTTLATTTTESSIATTVTTESTTTTAEATTSNPTTTTAKPSTTTAADPATTTLSTTSEVPPTTTTTEGAKSTTTAKEPATSTEEPAISTEEPATSTEEPAISTKEPTTTTKGTTTTTGKLTTTTEKLTTTTEKLTTSKPTTSSTPIPTTTTDMPTTSTLDPTTTSATTTTESGECSGMQVCETQSFSDECPDDNAKKECSCDEPKDQNLINGLYAQTSLFSDLSLKLKCKNVLMKPIFTQTSNKTAYKPFSGTFACPPHRIITGVEICVVFELKYIAIVCTEMKPGYKIDSETSSGGNSKSDPGNANCKGDSALSSIRLSKEGDEINVMIECAKIIEE